MSTFYYSVKGSADDSANVGVIEAKDEQAALTKLNDFYGNTKEKTIVEIAIISASEFRRIEAQKGEQLTHRPE